MKNILESLNFDPSESMVGLEREILLVAYDTSGKKYNLAMSREVVAVLFNSLNQEKRIKKYCKDGWLVVPEYSVSLIEIVSPPISIALFSELVEILETIQDEITLILQTEIYSHYPHLSSYTFSIETKGTSEVNEYLFPSGEIVTDSVTDPKNFLLEEDAEFAEKVTGHTLAIESHLEEGVGIYNHLGSTHVTFQPEYGSDSSKNMSKYVQFLLHLEAIIIEYKHHDNGNKKIVRDGIEYTSSENIRDMFLESMLELRYKLSVPISYQAASNILEEIERLNTLAQQIAVAHNLDVESVDNLDTIFRKWSSVNYRPRITKDGVPLIEVRAFGSNFDLQVLQLFVEHIRQLDESLDN